MNECCYEKSLQKSACSFPRLLCEDITFFPACPSTFCHVRKYQEDSHQMPDTGTFVLDFPASRVMRNKFVSITNCQLSWFILLCYNRIPETGSFLKKTGSQARWLVPVNPRTLRGQGGRITSGLKFEICLGNTARHYLYRTFKD